MLLPGTKATHKHIADEVAFIKKSSNCIRICRKNDINLYPFITLRTILIATTGVILKITTPKVLKPPRNPFTPTVNKTCSVVLTVESVDGILWCDRSNETSLAVLLHGTICFSIFCKM